MGDMGGMGKIGHTRLSIPRRAIAALGSLGAAIAMRSWSGSLPPSLWLPTALLAASALIVWSRHTSVQLLARAVWWSNLILAFVISVSSSGSDEPVAGVLGLGAGLALLAVGRADLDEDAATGRFVPVAFRGTLICMLVMALADAQSLVLFGSLRGLDDRIWTRQSVPLLGVGVLLLVAVVGLFRLRLWALALTLLSNLALAYVAIANVTELPAPLRYMYVASAAAQWLVALPLVVALVRRRAPQRRPSLEQAGYIAATSIIALMILAIALCDFVLHHAFVQY
jgi:hypothetical protein